MKTEETANKLLELITSQKAEVDRIEAKLANDIQEITQKYSAHLSRFKDIMHAHEKELTGLMKKNKATLFDGRDQVNLAAGILLYGKEHKVSIPKDALTKAEELGYTDAIKIAKSLDRSVIETWPIERIFMIGGKKRLVEKFDYELRDI